MNKKTAENFIKDHTNGLNGKQSEDGKSNKKFKVVKNTYAVCYEAQEDGIIETNELHKGSTITYKKGDGVCEDPNNKNDVGPIEQSIHGNYTVSELEEQESMEESIETPKTENDYKSVYEVNRIRIHNKHYEGDLIDPRLITGIVINLDNNTIIHDMEYVGATFVYKDDKVRGAFLRKDGALEIEREVE